MSLLWRVWDWQLYQFNPTAYSHRWVLQATKLMPPLHNTRISLKLPLGSLTHIGQKSPQGQPRVHFLWCFVQPAWKWWRNASSCCRLAWFLASETLTLCLVSFYLPLYLFKFSLVPECCFPSLSQYLLRATQGGSFSATFLLPSAWLILSQELRLPWPKTALPLAAAATGGKMSSRHDMKATAEIEANPKGCLCLHNIFI